ncbi:MAG: sarcosine/dimethylglycine N-methyltransferase [Rhodospirillaceae bacterium]|nr:sarcosine/dimethylglycine N-methyltransferase [Rhodospirillaceae bacterium]
MTDAAFRQAATTYRQTYDTALSELLSRIWGGHLHMGLFESPAEPLKVAQMRVNRYMAEAAALHPGLCVLETACGVGGTARFLAQNYGVRVLATNIAETQLAEGRTLTEEADLSHLVEFRFADYHDLPVGEASFDVWWCQEALLYSIDKRRVLEEALRVTRPGGRLILSDLLLDGSFIGAERQHFTTRMKAPDMWSIGQWDELLAGLPVEIIARHDWRQHTGPTFERVLDSLEQVRDEFTARIGAERVEGTLERVTMQLEAARKGKLGWSFYALKR